jgi:hypothetical protein
MLNTMVVWWKYDIDKQWEVGARLTGSGRAPGDSAYIVVWCHDKTTYGVSIKQSAHIDFDVQRSCQRQHPDEMPSTSGANFHGDRMFDPCIQWNDVRDRGSPAYPSVLATAVVFSF